MPALVTNNGLQRIGVQASQATAGAGPTYSAARAVQTMAWDDSTVTILAAHTALDDGGAVTNEYDQAFDAAPTRAGQTVTHTSTIPDAEGNFDIRRLTLHDDTPANVTTSSDTLVSGIDGQLFRKTSDVTLQTDLAHLHTT